ncbi:Uncharacterised protein [Mycobacteroides abscessus subsp. massiliense]|nr:Uncharacterised protein [Mycobacteroides abscessus subsp. massiliense]
MAPALAALHDHRVGAPGGDLLGVFGRSDGRNHHHAIVFELGDQVLLGCQRERGDLDLLADEQIDALGGVTGIGPDVHPKGLVGQRLGLGDGRDELVQRHRRRGQDAQPARVGGGGHQAWSGDPAHTRLHDGMLDTDQLGQCCLEHLRHCFTSLSRNDFGSITSRMSRSSSAVGSRVSPASANPCTSKLVLDATSSAVTPGCRVRARIW